MNMFMEVMHGGGVGRNIAIAPRRKRIWEIDQVFRCPVVGMCLSVREQRLLCRKVGAAEHAKSDFAVHEMLVATMNAENPLSRKLEALLARKYEAKHISFLDMAEDEFVKTWMIAVESGEYSGLLWAAAVRGLSHGAMYEVFGSMHMAMHEHAKAFVAARGSRTGMADRGAKLGERVRELEKANRKLGAENARLSRSLSASARQEGGRMPSRGPTGNPAAVAGRVDLEQSLAELREKLAARDLETAELRQALKEARQERDRIEDEFLAHLAMDEAMRKACAGEDCRGEACGGQECTPTCPSYSLCEKRVLIVGGIERMEKAYRDLVEKRGGIFEYHSGHMKSGAKALENSVQRADVVLCPVNCNSHGACLMVKSLGKKHKKPVHMLRNFSLSSLARTMDDMHVLPEGASSDGSVAVASSGRAQAQCAPCSR